MRGGPFPWLVRPIERLSNVFARDPGVALSLLMALHVTRQLPRGSGRPSSRDRLGIPTRLVAPAQLHEDRATAWNGKDTRSLPDDLLVHQSARLGWLYAVGVVLWAINFAMDSYLSPQGDRGPYRLPIEAMCGGLSAIASAYALFGRSRPRTKINVSLVAMVPNAFGLALLNCWAEQPANMRPLSGIVVLILLFGMIAPANPRKGSWCRRPWRRWIRWVSGSPICGACRCPVSSIRFSCSTRTTSTIS